MARVEASEQVVLPVPPRQAWEYLSDTAHMLELDPLLESYEPETGVIAEGTTNAVVSRLGPLRLRATTRTAVLDPPHRAVFESVRPTWPFRIRSEDTLADHPDGSLYRVTTTIDGAPLVGSLLAGPVLRHMMRTRRELMGHLRAELLARGSTPLE